MTYHKPIMYVQDVNETVLGITAGYYDATITSDGNSGLSVLTFTLPSNDSAARYLIYNYYVTFVLDGEAVRYQITNVEYTNGVTTVQGKSFSLELTNDFVDAEVQPSIPQMLTYYANNILAGTSWTIGVNESSSKTLHQITFSEQETVLSRLYNLADAFDLEMDFSITLTRFHATQKLVNFRQRLGANRNDIQLALGDNLSGITKTVDTNTFYTALNVTGGSISIASADYQSLDGRYKSPAGSTILYDVWANQDYNLGANYLVGPYSADSNITTVEGIISAAQNALIIAARPVTTVDVQGAYMPESLHLGDTVRIISNDPNHFERLSARVQTLTRSLDDPKKTTATFSSYGTLDDMLIEGLETAETAIAIIPIGLGRRVPINVTYYEYALGAEPDGLGTGPYGLGGSDPVEVSVVSIRWPDADTASVTLPATYKSIVTNGVLKAMADGSWTISHGYKTLRFVADK